MKHIEITKSVSVLPAFFEELHNWDVKAQCAPLFHGAAKVEECDANGSPYGVMARKQNGRVALRHVNIRYPLTH